MTVQAALDLRVAVVRDTLSVERGVDFADCGCVDGGVHDRSAVPAASFVAKDGVSAFPGGNRDAERTDCWCGASGASAAESYRYAAAPWIQVKGFVALSEREAESGDTDVIGDVRNCLSLARSLFVDEIFFSVPAEKKLVIGMVEEARIAGIDVRVVPDMYDGLAWNARVEYIGQFPTIPLHRKDFPIGGILVKRVLDITVASAGSGIGCASYVGDCLRDPAGFGRQDLL